MEFTCHLLSNDGSYFYRYDRRKLGHYLYGQYLVFAKTQEELERITKMVLQQLWDNDLYLKPKKCKFNKTIIGYLRLIIEEGQLSMDLVKLKGIMVMQSTEVQVVQGTQTKYNILKHDWVQLQY